VNILDYFKPEMKNSLAIKVANKVFNKTTGRFTLTHTLSKTVYGAYWIGSGAEALVNERLKKEISGVFVLKYMPDYTFKNSDISTLCSCEPASILLIASE
jgi:hypothetical protein